MAQINKELLELAKQNIDDEIECDLRTIERIQEGTLKVFQIDHLSQEDADNEMIQIIRDHLNTYRQLQTDLAAGNFNTDGMRVLMDFLRRKTKLKVPHNPETRELEMAMVSEFQDDIVKTETHPRTKKETTKLISQKAETTNGDLTIRSMTEIDAAGRETTQALCVPTDSTWIQCRRAIWIWSDNFNETGQPLLEMPLDTFKRTFKLETDDAAYRLANRIKQTLLTSYFNYYQKIGSKGGQRVPDNVGYNLVSQCGILNGKFIISGSQRLIMMYQHGRIKELTRSIGHINAKDFPYADTIYDKLVTFHSTLGSTRIATLKLIDAVPTYPQLESVKKGGTRHYDRFTMPLIKNLNALMNIDAINWKFAGYPEGTILKLDEFQKSYIDFEIL